MPKFISILFFLLTTASISWCIYRDIQIEKEYTGDLRNRVVGARLQEDGNLPYFYKWKNGDSYRYYDPQNFDTLKVSNITASPFFHQLLHPLVNLPQRSISKIWLCLEYLALLLMTGIALSFTKNRQQKAAVVITIALFLYTNAWTGHIAAGQLYLSIPLLAMLFYYFIRKGHHTAQAILAGLTMATLILIRPNTIVFFGPFLFLAQRYTNKFRIVFAVSALGVFLLALGTSRQRSYWQNYAAALTEQLKSHQGLQPARQQNDPDPHPANWEGWNTKQIEKEAAGFPYTYNMEHGNGFVIINNLLRVKTPVWLLATLAITAIGGLLLLFCKRYGHTPLFNPFYIAILAFCLYMISDIFSPIYRFQYNATQWLYPLLLFASVSEPVFKKVYLAVIAGILLNSSNLSFMRMEQSLGEYIIFGSLLILLFTPKPIVTK